MGVHEIGLEGLEWIGLIQNRDKWGHESSNEISSSTKCGEFPDYLKSY